MTSSSGPTTHSPRVCTSIGLADLGDCSGFSDPGEEGTYALRLDSKGVYSRVLLETPLPPEPEWLVKIGSPPHILQAGKAHTFRKLRSNGKMIASLVPVSGDRRDFFLKYSDDYSLEIGHKRKPAGALKVVAEFPQDMSLLRNLPPGYMVYLEYRLGVALTKWTPITADLSIKWERASNHAVVGMTLQPEASSSGETEIKFQATRPDVRLKTTRPIANLELLSGMGALRFRRLYIASSPIPDALVLDLVKGFARPPT